MAKVLLHTLLFPPDGNSNAYIFGDLALELQKRGHEVSVITTTPHYSVLQENLDSQPFTDGEKRWFKISRFNNMRCYHIVVPSEKGGMINRLKTYLKFHFYTLKLTNSLAADVVIAQSPPLSIGIINALIGKKLKAKSVYVVQDLFPDGPITQGKIKNRLLISLLRTIEKSVYKHNDAMVAISDGIKNHLIERIPNHKVLRMIPNFVDTDIYHPLPKDNPLVEKFGVAGKFVVSYVGNIGNAHDLSPILYCAKELADLDIVFIIAGSGINKDYYENKAKQQNLNNVRFIGYQKREDTPYINAFSDICLVMLAPHVKGFSFPSKIYTLMGMAKPVIVMCSSDCDAADFIIKNNAGWAVESNSYEGFTSLIKELYQDRGKVAQVGNKSLELIENGYTKNSVGNQYDQLIRELCNQN